MKNRQGVCRQRGFSLVELLVALAIGLIVALGAGQLFLVGLKNFRQVELIGNRQTTFMFAADMLIRDIRRADKGSFEIGNRPVSLTMSTEDGPFRYYLNNSQGEWSLYIAESGGNPQPLIGGFMDSESLLIKELEEGFFQIRFVLEGEGAPITFHAMNRATAMEGDT